MHHEIMLLLLEGKLHLAPLSNPQKILDIGTGTGIWAIDMADKYPMSKVIGTDLRYLWFFFENLGNGD
jgi:methylase of polypeptide subunit release factors